MTTLDVRTSAHGPGRTQYAYGLKSGGGSVVGPLEQEHAVDVSQDLVKDLCKEIDEALKNADDGDATLGRVLRQKGRLLFDSLFPRSGGPEMVRQLKESTGPLLVSTNESLVPWELLHDGDSFLGLVHELGRRSVVSRPVVGGRACTQVRRALVVGDTLGDLASAREETERISAWLREHGVTCTVLIGRDATLTRVIQELAEDEEPYDLFHYSGHVSGASGAAGLMVHNRKLIDMDALQPLAGLGAPPVVFINGCASAEPSLEPGARALAEASLTMSACMSFMVMGAKTVVGTRTPVGDASALRFAEAFYGQLQDQITAGAAMRQARADLERRADWAWASFVLYGDPEVRISTAAADVAAPLPPAPERPEFTPEAAELLRRTRKFAAVRGLVTSVDLLMALLEDDEVRERAAGRIGAQRMDLLAKVLRELQGQRPSDSTQVGTSSASLASVNGHGHGHGKRIALSDTVTRVLDGAEARAQEAGRDIGVDDISLAFLATGGGSCAELLQLFGVAPERLLLPGADAPAPGDDERVDIAALDPRAAAAVQCARLLASVQRKKISTYMMLRAFGIVGSEALRGALAAQGDDGAAAFRKLAGLGSPRPGEFSSRTLGKVQEVCRDAQEPVGEQELLIALLTDEDSTARTMLRRLGVAPELVIQSLQAPSP
ncbi:CHAT domain-containing protein [Streptomyces antnestii]|uniref:CHAT domain-containing protein n=1 Tax=Streptomyces antnestii TaxID=2494256 RepID=A0A3S2V9W5_9ACTN|nr:CHAT domain-containing protein [Streptomyces sp. San01]RVU17986.1 CHAT domain-containing protein [Streptomyces sp. San01]